MYAAGPAVRVAVEERVGILISRGGRARVRVRRLRISGKLVVTEGVDKIGGEFL
jgi:hypothetical protein